MLKDFYRQPIYAALFQLLVVLLGNTSAQPGNYNAWSRGLYPLLRGPIPYGVYQTAPYGAIYGASNGMAFPINRNFQRFGFHIPYPSQGNPGYNAIPNFQNYDHGYGQPPQEKPQFIETPRRLMHFNGNRPLPNVVTLPRSQPHHQQIMFKIPRENKVTHTHPHSSHTMKKKIMHEARKMAGVKPSFITVPKAKSFPGLLEKTALGSQLGR